MNLSNTISICISITGFFFFIRSFTRTIFLISQVILIIFFHDQPLVVWFFALFFSISVWSFDSFKEFQHEKELQWSSLDYLNTCILLLESGFSLQNALKESISCLHPHLQPNYLSIWQNLFQNVQIDRPPSAFFCRFSESLKFTAITSHKTLDQMKQLRSQIRTELYFRRKSGQILRSIRIQSFVMAVIYVFFIFVLQAQLDLFDYPRLFFGSAILFCSGLGILLKMGKEIKWKV